MKKIAVITAGGSGSRMGSNLPKQFMELKGKPVLWYTLKTFIAAFNDIEIVLVIPSTYQEAAKALLDELSIGDRARLVTGGSTRFHSVQNGLATIKEESVVFVHDGVRCLVTADLIQRCYHQALEKGSAVPAVASADSVRIAETDGDTHQSIDRNKVRIIQTPQTFKSNIILPAFQQEYTESFTDEATVVESNGGSVFLIEGEYTNLKITRPVDLVIAEMILQDSSAK